MKGFLGPVGLFEISFVMQFTCKSLENRLICTRNFYLLSKVSFASSNRYCYKMYVRALAPSLISTHPSLHSKAAGLIVYCYDAEMGKMNVWNALKLQTQYPCLMSILYVHINDITSLEKLYCMFFFKFILFTYLMIY